MEEIGVTNYSNGPQWATTDRNGYKLCLITATVQVTLLYTAVNINSYFYQCSAGVHCNFIVCNLTS